MVTTPTPEQAAANAFVTGCVKRGITASMAAVPPEGQLATVRGLWADVAHAAFAAQQPARADEFARVKVRLSALVASLDGTVERSGTSDEEFDRGAAHASAVTARQLREILNDTALGITPRSAAGSSFTEWAVFWGGEHPDDCAGLDAYDDEAEAEEMLQWIHGAGVATRAVTRGPWTVTRAPRPELAPGEPYDSTLTEAQREEYRQWLKEKHEAKR
jgi:hypothetical protein